MVLALIVVIGAGGYLLTKSPSTAAPVVETPATPSTDTGIGEMGTVPTESAVVLYSKAGFSPALTTISVGQSVTFKSTDGSSMWVASDQHPNHTGYDGTSRSEHCTAGTASESFDQCAPGAQYTFTFDKAGTWMYHNHVSAGFTGTVVVK